MFRPMRRKNQQLTQEESLAILTQATSGVLALSGDDGYPYALPISYALDGGRLIFHCAKSGHKLDAIARNPKASFCVIDQDKVVPEEYTTLFRSVIAFGTMRVLEGEEARQAVFKLADRYNPGEDQEHIRCINDSAASLTVLELAIEHLTGKQSKALLDQK